MGKGVFDIELENMGNDEISEIALAYNMLSKQMKKLIQENYEKGQLAKSSEMNLIQEQVNPHFLYNALSVISSIAMQEADDRTQEAIQIRAGLLLRYSQWNGSVNPNASCMHHRGFRPGIKAPAARGDSRPAALLLSQR